MGPGYAVGGVVAVGAAFVVEEDGVIGCQVCGTSILAGVEEEVFAYNFFQSDSVYDRYVWAGGIVIDGDIV